MKCPNRCCATAIAGTGSVLWEKALKPFWFLDFDDLALKWLKSLPDKSFSRIIPPGGTSAQSPEETILPQPGDDSVDDFCLLDRLFRTFRF